MSAALRVALALVLAVSTTGSLPLAATDDGPVGFVESGHVEFAESAFVEERGDVVTVPVVLPTNGEAVLAVESTAYRATVTVRDDGDGRARLRLNTYDGTWTVSSDDAIEMTNRTGPPADWTLPVGDYRLSLRSGDQGDRATLRLRERSLRRVGLLVANRSLDLRTSAEVRHAIDSDRLSWFEQPSRDANATLVARIDASGLEGALAAAPGRNVTERFRSLFARESATFRLEQTNPGPEVRAKVVHLDTGIRVVPDATNDSYFVVVHPNRANVTYRDDGQAEYFPSDEYRLNVSLGPDSRLTPDGASESREAVMYPSYTRMAVPPDEELRFLPARNQTVGGETAVGTGWNVTVTLRGFDDPETKANESFVRRQSARVRPNHDPTRYGLRGRFEAAFDLRNVTGGTELAVSVSFRGHSLLRDRVTDDVEPIPGFVAGFSASVDADLADEAGRYRAVRVDADLSRGGFVVLHAGSADGPIVGRSGFLPPGEHEVRVYVGRPTNATTVVAVAHRDGNHNEWFDDRSVDPPYDRGGPAEAVTVRTTTTPAPTTTDRRSGTTVATPSARESSGGGLPLLSGLVAVGGAATLLVAVGVLRRRRG